MKFYGWIVWHIWNTTVIFCCYHGNHLRTKALSENKENSFVLKCCYSRKKYLFKLKQHGLPDASGEEFSFKCLSVTIYEQFIVLLSSWLCCHGNRYYHIIFVTWESLGFSITSSSYKFISYIAENISIFNIWKLWLVRCDVIFSGRRGRRISRISP